MSLSTDRKLAAAFGAIERVPTPGLVTAAGVTGLTLFTDSTAAPFNGVRRVRVVNLHATQFLALFLVQAGAAAGSEAVSATGVVSGGAGFVIYPAGGELSLLVDAGLRCLIVGSASGTTLNAVVSDG